MFRRNKKNLKVIPFPKEAILQIPSAGSTPMVDAIPSYPTDEQIQRGLELGIEKVNKEWERMNERSSSMAKAAGWGPEASFFD